MLLSRTLLILILLILRHVMHLQGSPPERRRMHEAGETGSYADSLMEEKHPVTKGALVGSPEVYVAHAWDSGFQSMVEALVSFSQGELDKRYMVDVFSADLFSPPQDPVTTVMNNVTNADTVLLLVDAEGAALRRLWVILDALLASQAGNLKVRCTAPGGFGSSEKALKTWEALIDRADWGLAETSRKADEKRLRAFAEQEWETRGKGVERVLAQFR